MIYQILIVTAVFSNQIKEPLNEGDTVAAFKDRFEPYQEIMKRMIETKSEGVYLLNQDMVAETTTLTWKGKFVLSEEEITTNITLPTKVHWRPKETCENLKKQLDNSEQDDNKNLLEDCEEDSRISTSFLVSEENQLQHEYQIKIAKAAKKFLSEFAPLRTDALSNFYHYQQSKSQFAPIEHRLENYRHLLYFVNLLFPNLAETVTYSVKFGDNDKQELSPYDLADSIAAQYSEKAKDTDAENRFNTIPLTQRIGYPGVCRHYALMYTILAKHLNLPCRLVLSKGHVWNVCFTFDNKALLIDSNNNYLYFLSRNEEEERFDLTDVYEDFIILEREAKIAMKNWIKNILNINELNKQFRMETLENKKETENYAEIKFKVESMVNENVQLTPVGGHYSRIENPMMYWNYVPPARL